MDVLLGVFLICTYAWNYYLAELAGITVEPVFLAEVLILNDFINLLFAMALILA